MIAWAIKKGRWYIGDFPRDKGALWGAWLYETEEDAKTATVADSEHAVPVEIKEVKKGAKNETDKV